MIREYIRENKLKAKQTDSGIHYVISKKGPVTWRDYLTGLIPPILAAILVFEACYALQILNPELNPFIGLAIGLPLAIFITLAVYLIIPDSRQQLLDTKSMIKELRAKES